jgi:predicted secreted Zn-dependent protease
MKIPGALFLCLGWAACGHSRSILTEPLPAGLSLDLTEAFYGFAASTTEDVGSAMRQYGPEVGGERVPGATEQKITWDYQVVRSGGDCRLHAVEVHVAITTTLPRWENVDDAPEPLQRDWRRFLNAVRYHEDHHKEIILEGAYEVLRAIRTLAPGPCDRLAREVRAVGEAAVRRHHERNARFDRDTKGGSTEGVVWPPPRTRKT